MRWLMQMVFGWRWVYIRTGDGGRRDIRIHRVKIDPWNALYSTRSGIVLDANHEDYGFQWKPYGDWSKGRMTKEFAEWMVTFGEEKKK